MVADSPSAMAVLLVVERAGDWAGEGMVLDDVVSVTASDDRGLVTALTVDGTAAVAPSLLLVRTGEDVVDGGGSGGGCVSAVSILFLKPQ